MFVFISLLEEKKTGRLLIKEKVLGSKGKEISFYPREIVSISDFLLSNFRLLDIFIMGDNF